MDPAGHGGDQVAQDRGGGHFPGLLLRVAASEPGGAVDSDEEIQLALSGLNLGDINVKVAERVGLEVLRRELVALPLGQSRDVMTLQAAVQR